ncbi:carboxylate-amine ligase [Pseudorhodoplanes sinuspersici]|uniref:Putative glutamate--cysteine ligase 2 n=1 Tax=Pseudorhodoplanes sinuspersici TaxID=1235591 RepID=A0A1W6ZRH8_9HYPH|nr:carboxylate-amine ligase [Pseudorhodoplanes sinuspersici]ARQ00019.1 carboxylate-amine ligase [Pseudorhodoplanes sinuspersici]RKE71054.1 carboxylate-amine ligase [Pseudorhodoplanes sinuspersici]
MSFSFGIEEEYFLVDSETFAVMRRMPEGFFQAAKLALEDKVVGEFLQSQIEVVTAPHTDITAARDELRFLRSTLGEIAAQHGLSILASGTHPTAVWERSRQSAGERYDNVMDDLQMIGRRNMLCGMHVHVELPDPDQRIDIMTRMLPHLPLFIALSASSPFWRSQPTGLKGYRLAAYDELPRTGIPELFKTKADFDSYIEALVKAGIIPDSSYIWWAIRPSFNHPTLELRAPDACTRLADTIAIAALYRALARRLYYNPWQNWGMSPISRAIIVENKWRAQRYGVNGTFARIDGDGSISVAEMLEHTIEEVRRDAQTLGCLEEVLHCRRIIEHGTSADRQIAIYDSCAEEPEKALQAVTEWLADTTLQ